MVLKIDLEKELKRIEEDSKIVQGFNTVTAVRTLLSRLDQLAHDDPVAAFESLDAFDQKSKDGDSWDTLTANPELREKIKYDDEVGHNFEYLILKDEGNRLKITIDRKKANKDRENRSRIKKYKLARTVKITAVVITIIAVIVAFALYIYPTYIEERPIESISIDIPSEIQAGIEYSCPITILPTNASDKTLCLEYEDKDITANIEREKLNILLNDFVEDGKRIKLVVESEKYKTAYKELNLIAINDLTMDLEPSSNKASLGEIVTINVSFNRSVNPEMVWTCDNPNIELTPKGNNIEAYIKIEGWDEKDTKASITGAVKNTTYSKTADVMISTEFELSFKTAPTSLNIGESYLMEINLPIGYDATKIT